MEAAGQAAEGLLREMQQRLPQVPLPRMLTADDDDIVRRVRQEQAAAFAAAAGKQAVVVGRDVLRRGGAALQAAVHAALHPDDDQVPSSTMREPEPQQEPQQAVVVRSRQLAAVDLQSGGLALALVAAALGFVLGARYADNNQRGRQRRQRIAEGAQRKCAQLVGSVQARF